MSYALKLTGLWLAILYNRCKEMHYACIIMWQLVIQIYRQAEELENLKEAKTDGDAEETVRALLEFYNGPKFKTIISDTTEAIEMVDQTRKELTNVVKDLNKSIERQGVLQEKLNHAKGMIEKEIKEILSH
ncbi:MAG: hypothetical protein WBX01_13245 [Nitrososphaeraceae archaeon]